MISKANIDLIKSLFRGREDVYAVRWEKNGRGGICLPIKLIGRCKHDEIDVNSKIELLPHQKDVLEQTQVKDFGVIVSPPGSGKTIIGLALIAHI